MFSFSSLCLTLVAFSEATIEWLKKKLGPVASVKKSVLADFDVVVAKLTTEEFNARMDEIKEAKAAMVKAGLSAGLKPVTEDGRIIGLFKDPGRVFRLGRFEEDSETTSSISSEELLSVANSEDFTAAFQKWLGSYWPKYETYDALLASGFNPDLVDGFTVQQSQLYGWFHMSVEKLNNLKNQLRKEGMLIKELPSLASDRLATKAEEEDNSSHYGVKSINRMNSEEREVAYQRIWNMDPDEYKLLECTKTAYYLLDKCGITMDWHNVYEPETPETIREYMKRLDNKPYQNSKGESKSMNSWTRMYFFSLLMDRGVIQKDDWNMVAYLAGADQNSLYQWRKWCDNHNSK